MVAIGQTNTTTLVQSTGVLNSTAVTSITDNSIVRILKSVDEFPFI